MDTVEWTRDSQMGDLCVYSYFPLLFVACMDELMSVTQGRGTFLCQVIRHTNPLSSCNKREGERRGGEVSMGSSMLQGGGAYER